MQEEGILVLLHPRPWVLEPTTLYPTPPHPQPRCIPLAHLHDTVSSSTRSAVVGKQGFGSWGLRLSVLAVPGLGQDNLGSSCQGPLSHAASTAISSAPVYLPVCLC